jgi:VanZ family protein
LKALKQFVLYWLPPLAWMGLIYGLSSQSMLPELPDTVAWYEAVDTALHKCAHMVAYGVLAWLYLRVLGLHFDPSATLRVVSIVAAMVYGLTDEYHQTFVPGREGRLSDVGVDTVGACAAMVVDRWVTRRRLRRKGVPPAESLAR